MNILTLTSLFPNSAQPRFGIFIANRLAHLQQQFDVNIDVIAPVPWFPGAHWLPSFKVYSHISANEKWRSLDVVHPRFLSIPGRGFGFKPQLFARAMLSAMDKNVQYDLIDAHYAYPDGVAAMLVARHLNLPMVLSVRGSDINQLAKHSGNRKSIRKALNHAKKVIAVSEPLALEVNRIEPNASVQVIENGVDREVFYFQKDVQKEPFLLLSVGNLVSLKGHHLAIEALRNHHEWQLTIIGEGPEKSKLLDLIHLNGLQQRVTILPNMSQQQLAQWYNRAQATLLVSENEGCPNVVIESQSCGTPVLATRVGACEDLIEPGRTGLFIENRSASGVATALATLRQMTFNHHDIAHYGERFDWRHVCDRQMQVYRQAVEKD